MVRTSTSRYVFEQYPVAVSVTIARTVAFSHNPWDTARPTRRRSGPLLSQR